MVICYVRGPVADALSRGVTLVLHRPKRIAPTSPHCRYSRVSRTARAGYPSSGRQDLNLRPPAPKAGALPSCATSRCAFFKPDALELLRSLQVPTTPGAQWGAPTHIYPASYAFIPAHAGHIHTTAQHYFTTTAQAWMRALPERAAPSPSPHRVGIPFPAEPPHS